VRHERQHDVPEVENAASDGSCDTSASKKSSHSTAPATSAACVRQRGCAAGAGAFGAAFFDRVYVVLAAPSARSDPSGKVMRAIVAQGARRRGPPRAARAVKSSRGQSV
jgi:hypothetical protein